MTLRQPKVAIVAATLLAVACAALFVAGRHSVDRTPPRLATPAVTPLHVAPVAPAIVLPPKAVLR